MKGLRVLILIGGHLATAPRAQKEAAALRAAGAEVHVRGTWWNERLSREDLDIARSEDYAFKPVVDLTPGKGRRIRLLQRASRELSQRLGITTARAFGVGAPEMLRTARDIGADITIVHSEAGLWAGKKLLEEGMRVGVDFEDWFSNDLREADRKGRPVTALQELERYLLVRAHSCTAATEAMAKALASDAGTRRTPVPIPNCFPAAGRQKALRGPKDERARSCLSFHWFSQTIGPGRGLETLGRAMLHLKGDWRVTLRGASRGYGRWLEDVFSPAVRGRVEILDPVPNAELLARTMSHDVGLALEEPYCASRDLTATNKIFEYLRAGLAVVATRTEGQQEVMRACPDAGATVSPGDEFELARAMQNFIDHPDLVRSAAAAAVRAAETSWAWERFRPVLQETIAEAVRAGL